MKLQLYADINRILAVVQILTDRSKCINLVHEIYNINTYLHSNNGVDEEQHGYEQAHIR